MAVEVISSLADQYSARYSTPEDRLLQTIAEETYATHPEAHMLSGHVQGRFLSFVSQMLRPKYILEIGTFTGYSALCLSEGLAEDGELHTIELREQDANTALKYFREAGKEKQIKLHVGNAKELIPKLPYKWDLVFIDADKTAYVDYYETVLLALNEKGYIIADNVLFHGQVLETPVRGKNAIAIDNFNKHVAQDHRVEQVMLTLRDGLLLVKKK